MFSIIFLFFTFFLLQFWWCFTITQLDQLWKLYQMFHVFKNIVGFLWIMRYLKMFILTKKKKKCLVNCQLGYIRKCDKLWKTVPFKTRWSRKVFRISPLLMKLVSHGSVNCSDLSCAESSFVLNDIREEAVTHYMQVYGVLCHSHSEWEDSWMEGALPQSVHLYNVKTQFNLHIWRKKLRIYLSSKQPFLFCFASTLQEEWYPAFSWPVLC